MEKGFCIYPHYGACLVVYKSLEDELGLCIRPAE